MKTNTKREQKQLQYFKMYGGEENIPESSPEKLKLVNRESFLSQEIEAFRLMNETKRQLNIANIKYEN